MGVELRQLRYLLAIADTGSFTAAARQSFVTQPTLSTAIGNLESELGQQLFERTSRGAIPTPDGRRAIEHARAALSAAEAIRAPAGPGTPARALRIGVGPTLPIGFATSATMSIRERLSGQQIRVEAGPLVALRRRLMAGRLDVLVTTLNETTTRDLRQLELGNDEMCLLYESSRRPAGTVTPEILHDAPLIVRTHCEYLSTASRTLDERQVRPVIAARVDTDALALGLVGAGLGACLMPDSFANDNIVAADVDGLDLRRRLGLEWLAEDLDILTDLDGLQLV